jgi:hypothetical protein
MKWDYKWFVGLAVSITLAASVWGTAKYVSVPAGIGLAFYLLYDPTHGGRSGHEQGKAK